MGNGEAMQRWYGPKGGLPEIWEALGGEVEDRFKYRVARMIADRCKLTAPGVARILKGQGQEPRAETLVEIYGTLPAVAEELAKERAA